MPIQYSKEKTASPHHKDKSRKWYKYFPCEREHATWVPAKLLPQAVLNHIKECRASERALRYVIQSKRLVLGPARGHEQLQVNANNTLFQLAVRWQSKVKRRPWDLIKNEPEKCHDADESSQSQTAESQTSKVSSSTSSAEASTASPSPVKRTRQNADLGISSQAKSRQRLDTMLTDDADFNEKEVLETMSTVVGQILDVTSQASLAVHSSKDVPAHIETKIDEMLTAINQSYDQVHESASDEPYSACYNKLCNAKYFTGKLSLHDLLNYDPLNLRNYTMTNILQAS